MISTVMFCIVLLLASTEDCKGIHHSLQTNTSFLERRAVEPPAKKPKKAFNCATATYKTVTIQDFVYTHHCFPQKASWIGLLEDEEVKKEISAVSSWIKSVADKGKIIEPPMPHMFRAFNVPLNGIKAIILGQDPTPQAGKATGLALSLKPYEDPSTVPSVFNMLVELKWKGMNVGLTNGDLTPWLGQGVLLLNSALTINQGAIGSHQAIWRKFTELLVNHISKNAQPSAWILWGKEAEKAALHIDKKRHYIKTGGHPSPLAATGFFGGNYFTCANDFLGKMKRGKIDWQIPGGKRPIEQC